jgi:hypothetical protein
MNIFQHTKEEANIKQHSKTNKNNLDGGRGSFVLTSGKA